MRGMVDVQDRRLPSQGLGRAGSKVAWSSLGEIAEAIRKALPFRADELGRVVEGAGLVAPGLKVEHVVRAFHDGKARAPFRLVRRGGVTILVSSTSVTAAETVLSEANLLILHWGLCTVGTVVDRLRSLKRGRGGSDATVRILAAVPRVIWLDDARQWFSMAGLNSRLLMAIGKVFAVVSSIPLAQLKDGLSKRAHAIVTAPAGVLEAYLSKVAGCIVERGWVRPTPVFVPAALDRHEGTLIALLTRHGGSLAWAPLRRLAKAAGVGLGAVHNIVRTSPLLSADPSRVRLLWAFDRFEPAALPG